MSSTASLNAFAEVFARAVVAQARAELEAQAQPDGPGHDPPNLKGKPPQGGGGNGENGNPKSPKAATKGAFES